MAIKLAELSNHIILNNIIYELQGRIGDFPNLEVFIYVNNPGVEDNNIDPISVLRNKHTGEITL
jgi:hypothetical protein